MKADKGEIVPGVRELEEVGGLDAVADEVGQCPVLHGDLLASMVDSVLPLSACLLRVQLQRQVELVQLHQTLAMISNVCNLHSITVPANLPP